MLRPHGVIRSFKNHCGGAFSCCRRRIQKPCLHRGMLEGHASRVCFVVFIRVCMYVLVHILGLLRRARPLPIMAGYTFRVCFGVVLGVSGYGSRYAPRWSNVFTFTNFRWVPDWASCFEPPSVERQPLGYQSPCSWQIKP